MEVTLHNLVGPRGEKFESTEPFWSFFLFTSKWEVHMSFPKEVCSYRDAVREVHLYAKLLKLVGNRTSLPYLKLCSELN
jgi:hypothetical protein